MYPEGPERWDLRLPELEYIQYNDLKETTT